VIAFAIWAIGSLPTPFEHIWFHMLFHLTRWLQQCSLGKARTLSHDQHLVDVFFPLSIEILIAYINKQTNFSIDVQTWCGQQSA
jgi:hypothetical protein